MELDDNGSAVVQPRPASLVESLRGFGYDMATALADLIDNSLAAEAREVRVEYCLDEGAAWVAVVDDGRGLAEAELHEALRFGGDGPDADRAAGDLGRFGLGLKTASLSQCRMVTVLSRTESGLASRTWDIDVIRVANEWRLLTVLDGEADKIAREIGFDGIGTMVLWRGLDRAGDGRALASRIGNARSRLAMWFHRFLAAGRLRLTLGSKRVDAWDPFWRQHMATQDMGTERLGLDGSVSVTPFVLPHPARLSDAEAAVGAGPRGWNAQQGLYVYRGERLVSAGGWLNLPDLTIAHQTRLARIEVHIDPSADFQWQIDVRKSTVHVPADLEADLLRLAEAARDASVRVFRRRAAAATERRVREITFGWVPEQRHGATRYVVNREHPIVATALTAPSTANVAAMLRLIERTVPVDAIALEAENNPNGVPQAALEGAAEAEAHTELAAMLAALPDDPAARRLATRALASVEPFNRFPALLAEIAGQERLDGASS